MPEQPRPPERTSGTEDREPRTLISPVEVYDLQRELERLTREPEWSDGHQNAVTLAKGSNFRVVLVAMKPGARVGEDEAHGRMSVQVLRGAVSVQRPDKGSELAAGQLAALDAGQPWSIEARDESAILLTIAWPEERSLL
jgi:quercetin dioxygenase-like cupin family protein